MFLIGSAENIFSFYGFALVLLSQSIVLLGKSLASYGKLCVVLNKLSPSLSESMVLLSTSMALNSKAMVMYCETFGFGTKFVVFLKTGGVQHTCAFKS